MVGAVLIGFEEEADMTRHRPMFFGTSRHLMIGCCCLATDLVCPHARSVALKNNKKPGMEVAHFMRSIEVFVVNCACWDHTMYPFNTCFC